MGKLNKNGKIIEKTVNEACENYSKALNIFKPQAGKGSEREEEWGENGFPERNLSCCFAQTFLKNNKKGYAFFEVPFRFSPKEKYKHIDAYVISDKIGILIETKRLYSIEKFRDIVKDAERLSSDELKETIKKHHKDKEKYLKIPHFALILVEAWGEEYKVWWESKPQELERKWKEKAKEWENDYITTLNKFKKWNSDKKSVFEFRKEFDHFGASKEPYHTYGKDSEGVYCLYAYCKIW